MAHFWHTWSALVESRGAAGEKAAAPLPGVTGRKAYHAQTVW